MLHSGLHGHKCKFLHLIPINELIEHFFNLIFPLHPWFALANPDTRHVLEYFVVSWSLTVRRLARVYTNIMYILYLHIYLCIFFMTVYGIYWWYEHMFDLHIAATYIIARYSNIHYIFIHMYVYVCYTCKLQYQYAYIHMYSHCSNPDWNLDNSKNSSLKIMLRLNWRL